MRIGAFAIEIFMIDLLLISTGDLVFLDFQGIPLLWSTKWARLLVLVLVVLVVVVVVVGDSDIRTSTPKLNVSNLACVLQGDR